MKLLISLILMSMLAGCATQPSQATKEELSKLPSSHGVMVASYARSSPSERFSNEAVYFRKVGSRKRKEIGIHTMFMAPLNFDFKNNESCGSLVVMSLPEGDYEMYDYAVIQDVFGGTITHTPRSPFSIPFKVLAGKISYFGELKINRIHGTKFLGISGNDSVQFEISDQSKRDLAILRQKYPDLGYPVSLVKPSRECSTPFFRIE